MPEPDKRHDAASPEYGLGMNFISADFSIVMVNRANERFYNTPVVAMLGKKCYHEFEQRDEPCPHCPGRLALATGETRETERVGILGDGTLSAVRIRAHPVMGPDERPTGFIEVVENITEQKRGEHLVRVEADLLESLVAARSSRRALREVLDAAMQIEGIDWACVFTVDQDTGKHSLLAHRNVSSQWLDRLTAASRGEPGARTQSNPGDPQVLQLIPITLRGSLIGTLLAGASTQRELPPAVRTGLRSLGTIAGNAISRILAEQSVDHAIADFEAFIGILPIAAWILDSEERVTFWNTAAEKLFGWEAAEMLGGKTPFGRLRQETCVTEMTDKVGKSLTIRLLVAPFRDVLGGASSTVFLAEDLTRETASAAGAFRPLPSLIVDFGETWGLELAHTLEDLGHIPTRCRSLDEITQALAEAEDAGRPFAFAVVGVVSSLGMSGLDQKAALRARGFTGPVVLSSETEVRGYEHHGIAAVVQRPFTAEAIRRALRAGGLTDRP